VPIGRQGEVPQFPVGCLPSWLSDWVSAEAEATQTPADLAGCLALAVAALARRVRVRVRDDWKEPANPFTVVSLPPGERKSAVFADAIAPLAEHERQEQERAAPSIAELASDRRVMELRLKGLESQAAKADDKIDADRLRAEAKDKAKELAAHRVPDSPQFWCNDVTPQDLARVGPLPTATATEATTPAARKPRPAAVNKDGAMENEMTTAAKKATKLTAGDWTWTDGDEQKEPSLQLTCGSEVLWGVDAAYLRELAEGPGGGRLRRREGARVRHDGRVPRGRAAAQGRGQVGARRPPERAGRPLA
jgi:hypothetical protein